MRGILAVNVLTIALCIAATRHKAATQTRDNKVRRELMQMESDWSEASEA